MRIFLIGLTSGRLGGMESCGNLGNYVIMEPFIEHLIKEFPDASITTTIQMSDKFCSKYNIISLRNKRFYTYALNTARQTVSDIFKLIIWKFFKIFTINWKNLLKKSLLLKEIYEADLVIDFSGDTYGDNSPFNKFLEGSARILFSKYLGKPVAMIIGSPGPFKKKWRQILAKYVFKKIDLVTNREPVSTDVLKNYGIIGNHIKNAACPSFLFRARKISEIQDILDKEGISFYKEKKILLDLLYVGGICLNHHIIKFLGKNGN